MQTLNQDIKERRFRRVYLLFGEEPFLVSSYKKRLREAISGDDTMNFNYFEGKSPDVKEIISLADTMPFFAERRRTDGSFLVDAIGTDGGGIPRNVILESGLSLVKLGALDPVDFAVKTSYLPSRMLGLTQKGTLAPGSDADLTIYDPVAQRAVHSFVKGEFLLRDGRAVGREARIVCTEAGVEAVRRAGLEPVVVSGGIPTLDRRRAAGIA